MPRGQEASEVTVRACVAAMSDVRKQMPDFGCPFGPTACQESLEVGRRARFRRHGTRLRQVDATHLAIDSPGAETQLPRYLRNSMANVAEASDLIKKRLRRRRVGVALTTHRIPCGFVLRLLDGHEREILPLPSGVAVAGHQPVAVRDRLAARLKRRRWRHAVNAENVASQRPLRWLRGPMRASACRAGLRWCVRFSGLRRDDSVVRS
jgi:hypothetical protein